MKNVHWKQLLPHVIAIVIFVIIAVLFAKPTLEGKVLQQSDVIHWRGMAQDLIQYKATHGKYPLWNNNLFGGMPAYQIILTAANPVSVVYAHPLFMLFLPKPIGFFFLLCISFYFLSQVLRINPWIGIGGSIGYAYASFSAIIVAAGHDTQMLALGYVPALMGAIWLIYQKKYWWGTALTALFSALLIAQNHLQIAYYFIIIAGFMTIGFIIQWLKAKDYQHLVKALVLTLIAGAIGATCNLVSLATTNDYSKATMRNGTLNLDTTNHANTTRKNSGLPIDYAFNWSYGRAESFTLLIPDVYGGASNGELNGDSHIAKILQQKGVPDDQAAQFAGSMPSYWGSQPFTSGPVYLGAVLCLLFIFGMVYLKTPHKWWILALTIVALLMSWGKNLMFFNEFLFNHLPLYNKFRVPTMTLVIPQFTFPLVAVMVLQQLFFDTKDKLLAILALKKTLIITGAFFVLAILLYFSFDYAAPADANLKTYFNQLTQGNAIESNSIYNALIADRRSLFATDLIRSIIFVILAAASIFFYLKNKLKATYAIAAFVVLIAADNISIDRRYFSDKNFQDEDTIDDTYFKPTAADLQIMKDTSYYRVLNLTQDVFNDALTSYHFHSVGGYHPAKLSIVEDLLNFQLRKQPMNMQVLNMLNTKYIIVNNPATNKPEVQLNPNALGPCWFVKTVQFVNGPAAVMKSLDHFTPKDTAIVELADQSLVTYTGTADSTATIHLVKNDNDIIHYTSNSNTNGFAVFSEIYYNRGWKAYIDGKETPIIQTNYVLRGLSIPAGKHDIVFEFKPASYYNSTKIAIGASALVWLLLIGAIVSSFKQGKQNDAA
ncbi:MAG: YfhO family protein [Hydrotalea flava]|uniref:YfhO family protein n=1 Tax=Hydrotalea lipotrueae TaxID=2803817 RepID=UPI000B1753AD|nr:YfhO family protein [Hydrotalea lipotrueae]MBY0348326.1 YfhO family protein [Hydrotalea flava]